MQPNSNNLQNDFQKAIALQAEKKYDDALSLYSQILQNYPDLSPNQVADISYNAALSAFLKNDYATSYVFNQKSLLLNPYNNSAMTLTEKIKEHFQPKTLAHDISLLENLNKSGFAHLPVELLWVFSTVFFALFLNGILRYFASRKKALIDNTNLPSFSLKNYVFLCVFLLMLFFTGLKVWDTQAIKAFIKIDQAAVYTFAGENQARLVDLPVGSLVHVLRKNQINDQVYFQIKYPGGVSGWVKQEDLEVVFMPKD